MKLTKRAMMGALVFAPAIVGLNRIAQAVAAKTLKIKIGRASCRERV